MAADKAHTWIRLFAGSGVSTAALPRVARRGSQLLVTWQQSTASDLNAVNTRVLARAASSPAQRVRRRDVLRAGGGRSGLGSGLRIAGFGVNGTGTTPTLNTTGGFQYTGISAGLVGDRGCGGCRTRRRTRPAPTPLDAVINVIGKEGNASGDATAEIFSTRILKGLQVAVSPAKVSYVEGAGATDPRCGQGYGPGVGRRCSGGG